MQRKAAWFMVLLLVMVSITACSSTEAVPAVETPSILGEQIEVRVGESFVLSQRGDPVSGFLWAVQTPPSDILVQVGDLLVELDSDDEDAEASFIYTYQAVSAGTTYIKLIYHQPFESAPPSAIYEATIVVSP